MVVIWARSSRTFLPSRTRIISGTTRAISILHSIICILRFVKPYIFYFYFPLRGGGDRGWAFSEWGRTTPVSAFDTFYGCMKTCYIFRCGANSPGFPGLKLQDVKSDELTCIFPSKVQWLIYKTVHVREYIQGYSLKCTERYCIFFRVRAGG